MVNVQNTVFPVILEQKHRLDHITEGCSLRATSSNR